MLHTGTRIGPYEVLGTLGAGGMGEVYRAHDQRLGRDVAVKVMPESFAMDRDRLRRFKQEAQTAGMLNHPNLLSVYDFGSTEDGAPYIVTELLEGDTLREKLANGPLPTRKVIDYATQIVQGLAAAHEKGIVHRDLKPENLFVTRDGRVKILDFGLAKLLDRDVLDVAQGEQSHAGTQTDRTRATVLMPTHPGTLLGTVGYMSPEQVRGQGVDHRSDLFSFGTILYEMLTGTRAFGGDSGVETMYAILEADPPDVGDINESLPPALIRILNHALEKHPEERFQSARDLGFHLQAISDPSGSLKTGSVRFTPRRRSRWLGLSLAATAVAVLVAFAAYQLGAGSRPESIANYHQLTFGSGFITSGRFAPDGQTMLYSASWNGQPHEVFSTRVEGSESRSLGVRESGLLALSSTGEVAVALDHKRAGAFSYEGTLARVQLSGGAPRKIVEGVQFADWSPDGSELAIVRYNGEGMTLIEYPIGSVIAETRGWYSHLRVAPDGKRLAFIHHDIRGDDGGFVVIADPQGNSEVETGRWASAQGLAWSSSGSEVWFTAAREGLTRTLHAVDLAGRERVVLRAPGILTLHDVASDGRVLLNRETWRMRIGYGQRNSDSQEDLSWLDWSLARDLSADGKTLLFDETGQGAGKSYGVYIRKTDGSPAVRLGNGVAVGLSPDGKWVLSFNRDADQPTVALLPTGPGVPRFIKQDMRLIWMRWFPDSEHVLLWGGRENQWPGLHVQHIDSTSVRTLSPHGTYGNGVISPDGKWIAARDRERRLVKYPFAGGDPITITEEPFEYNLAGWMADGNGLFVTEADGRTPRMLRYDIASGKTEEWLTLQFDDKAGLVRTGHLVLTPDGETYAHSYGRILADLYMVEGLH